MKNHPIIIDSEFRSLVPPMSADSLAVGALVTDTAIETADVLTVDLPLMPSEELAMHVEGRVLAIGTKLAELQPFVEELWLRFENLKDGETIHGCFTKKDFCETHLKRTPRAVRYMLEGGNHKRGIIADVGRNRKLIPLPEKGNVSPPADSESDIWLESCSRTDPRYEEIREDHYIPNHGAIGQQAHFLIHYKDKIAGIISGASPVYATSSRDKFFGVDKKNRSKFLQGIVNNIVFRLENHEPNLATRVLKLWRNIIPHFWYEKYGTVVYGFETFVIENDTRKGSLYKADNWTLAGKTAGATKVRDGIDKPADNWKEVTPKLVYCRWPSVPTSLRQF